MGSAESGTPGRVGEWAGPKYEVRGTEYEVTRKNVESRTLNDCTLTLPSPGRKRSFAAAEPRKIGDGGQSLALRRERRTGTAETSGRFVDKRLWGLQSGLLRPLEHEQGHGLAGERESQFGLAVLDLHVGRFAERRQLSRGEKLVVLLVVGD